MECGNDMTRIVELDMILRSFVRGFLSIANRGSFEQNILFILYSTEFTGRQIRTVGRSGPH